MIDVPIPMITGTTDAEKITNIISYLSQLTSALERTLTSIDYSNLSANLAERIKNSLTEHQDLSAYATTAHVDKKLEAYATEDYVGNALGPYATKTYVGNYVADFVTESDVEKMLEEYATIEYVDGKL